MPTLAYASVLNIFFIRRHKLAKRYSVTGPFITTQQACCFLSSTLIIIIIVANTLCLNISIIL